MIKGGKALITIQAAFTQTQRDLGLIGRAGENASRQIAFDCADVLSAFPGAGILCVYQRPGESTPYPIPLSASGGVYTLTLAAVDTALAGFARIELRAEKEGAILKSASFTGQIAPSLRAPGERPSPAMADTLDRLAALIEQAQQRLDELASQPDPEITWESVSGKPALAPSLTLQDGALSVVTASAAQPDNPLPITSAAVYEQLGSISALLASI